MAAAADIRIAYTQHELEHAQDELPPVLVVSEMPEDELIAQRAKQLIRGIGSEMLSHTAPTNSVFECSSESDYASLRDAAHAAHEGDERAVEMIRTNALTHFLEGIVKAGMVTEVDLEVDPEGHIMQHGQRMDDVYKNALRLDSVEEMHLRTQAEIINGFRMRSLRDQGLLKEYAFVVFSRYPDDMSDDEAAKAGFFVDTKTCSIQTLHEWDGKLVQESAFVAGATSSRAERHDRVAIERLFAELGVSIDGLDATATIGRPLLIHRSLMTNGVVNLVARYDRHAGGTFFGQDRPLEDYLAFRSKSMEWQAQLGPRVQGIVDALVEEAPHLRTPLAAFRRLHELAQRAMVDYAMQDTSINPRVFGPQAAAYIEQGRFWLERGDYGRFMEARDGAQQTARTSSCPIGMEENERERGNESSRQTRGAAASHGERKRMTCPFCGDRNQYGDPCDSNQHCTNCNARVVGGKIVYKGNGGRKQAAPATTLPEALIFRRKETSRKVAQVALAA